MGQDLSLLHRSQAVDIKKQASAVDLLDDAVWYYDPVSGRNLWGNRAALELFAITQQVFCAQQHAACFANSGVKATEAWLQSNQELVRWLETWQAQAPDAKQDVSNYRNISIVGTSSVSSCCGDSFPSAGFLPLPAGVRQLSARACPCVVRSEKKLLLACQIQVVSWQRLHEVRTSAACPQARDEGNMVQLMHPNLLEQQQKSHALQAHYSSEDKAVLSATDGSAHINARVQQEKPKGNSSTCLTMVSSTASLCSSGRVEAPAAGSNATLVSVDKVELSHCWFGNSECSHQASPSKLEAQYLRRMRLTEMCNNHAMFHFLFDAEGQLLAANNRAMDSIKEHLGDQQHCTLPQYLAFGQCDANLNSTDMFKAIQEAIIVQKEPCYRLPQLRWSKRQPGKHRWVLYEVWPMDDPVTGQPSLLVTEHNITQVKALEEQYSQHMQQLESQLEEARKQQQQTEIAAWRGTATLDPGSPDNAFTTSSAAQMTLQLLEKLLNGDVVSVDEAEDLQAAILEGGNSLHAPLFLDQQVLNHTQALAYAPEVGASLLQMLSTHQPEVGKDPLPEDGEADSLTSESNAMLSPRWDNSNHGGGFFDSRFANTHDKARTSVASNIEADARWQTSGTLSTAGEEQLTHMSLMHHASLASDAATNGVSAAGSHPQRLSVLSMVAGGTSSLVCSTSGAGRSSVATAAREIVALTSAPTTDLEAVLAKVDDWQFDSFGLCTAANGRPLSALGFFLLKRSNLMQRLALDEMRLARWLVRLEDGYRANPYHNRIHAADVLRSAHVLSTRGQIAGTQGLDDVTQLALYLAAMVHDFEHKGVNNDFLVRTGDALALLYNDHSPNENHHMAASWGHLVKHNFLSALPVASKELLRRLVIELVLATDMKQHFAIHGLFQSKIHMLVAAGLVSASSAASGTLPPVAAGLATPSRLSHASSRSLSVPGSRHRTTDSMARISAGSSQQHMQPLGDAAVADKSMAVHSATPAVDTATASMKIAAAFSAAGGLNNCQQPRSTGGSHKAAGSAGCVSVSWEDDAETRSLYLKICLKAADLGHLAASKTVHRKWVEALEEENFRQGDRERAAGMSISPLMDRTRAGITKSQVGFFDIVALPLFRSVAQRFPSASPMLDSVLDNYNMWKQLEHLTSPRASQ